LASPDPPKPAQSEDWLALCRRAAKGAEDAIARYPRLEDRSEKTGRGEGGDMALIIDRAAEDAIFAELEALGEPLTAISEERGRVAIRGGGTTQVVIDPIDGSLNAKRGMPLYCLSIAVADGLTMGDVKYGFVHDFGTGEEWWAGRGEGAFLNGQAVRPLHETGGRVEVLGIESGDPRRIARHATALAATTAHRLRLIGSIALGLCWVAGARFDALLSLRSVRSVDAAAGQLIVREAGGDVLFPDTQGGDMTAPLDLDMRSTVVAARAHSLATELARGVLGA
jgi:myo-inositol-1(or 4)-monophosphatase